MRGSPLNLCQPSQEQMPLSARGAAARDAEHQPLLGTADAERGEMPMVSTMTSLGIEDDFMQDHGSPKGVHVFGHADDGAVNRTLDIVQFSNLFFYTSESTGKVVLTAMRIGGLQGICSAEFYTEDNSAKAGHKYKMTRGKIEFLPGEELKSVEIKILQDDSFDTNLDFKVKLSDPIGCQLSESLNLSWVVIMDDDVFPTNIYREEILKNDTEDLGLRLLYHFYRFCVLRIPNVGWLTFLNLLLDQLYNVNYLVGIWLSVYMVDTVFAIDRKESLEELWIPHHRLATLIVVAIGIIVPKILLMTIEFLKEGSLAVGGKVDLHLKVNMFRKYLYYSKSSHAQVSVQEVTKSMEGDIAELVKSGFMIVFKLVQQTVKVCVILYFLIRKRPSSAVPMLIYPVAMFLVLNLRYESTLKLKAACLEAEKDTMTCLRQSCNQIDLLKQYNMRNAVVNQYQKSIGAEHAPGDAYARYDFRTMLVMPWITNIAIAMYTVVGGHFVLQGDISLGAYLATLNIYQDAGNLFGGFYAHLKECYAVIGPLLRLVRLLNLDADVDSDMKQAEERHQGMMKELKADSPQWKQYSATAKKESRFDLLRIRLIHASLANDQGGPTHAPLQDLSPDVPQGQMCAILGPHGTGKFSLIRLLTGLVKPKNGQVQIPTHLRTLCIPNRPVIVTNGNLLENLTFGTGDKYDKARLVKVCGAVGLGTYTLSLLDRELQGNTSDTTPASLRAGVHWFDQLSQIELLKISIARGINLNPEVLLLHRPVDEMEADHAARILDVFRKHVDHKGLYSTLAQRESGRPHTVFFTTGEDRERAESAADVADVVWHLSEQGFRSEPGGRASGAEATAKESDNKEGNKIVSSWSREVRNLEQNLMKAKGIHSSMTSQLHSHKSDLETLRDDNQKVRGTLEEMTQQAKEALRNAQSLEVELHNWQDGSSALDVCVSRPMMPSPRNVSQNLMDIISKGEAGVREQDEELGSKEGSKVS